MALTIIGNPSKVIYNMLSKFAVACLQCRYSWTKKITKKTNKLELAHFLLHGTGNNSLKECTEEPILAQSINSVPGCTLELDLCKHVDRFIRSESGG